MEVLSRLLWCYIFISILFCYENSIEVTLLFWQNSEMAFVALKKNTGFMELWSRQTTSVWIFADLIVPGTISERKQIELIEIFQQNYKLNE